MSQNGTLAAKCWGISNFGFLRSPGVLSNNSMAQTYIAHKRETVLDEPLSYHTDPSLLSMEANAAVSQTGMNQGGKRQNGNSPLNCSTCPFPDMK